MLIKMPPSVEICFDIYEYESAILFESINDFKGWQFLTFQMETCLSLVGKVIKIFLALNCKGFKRIGWISSFKKKKIWRINKKY